MEREFLSHGGARRRILRKSVMLALCLTCASFGVPQEVKQDEYIRIQIWAELDAFPGRFEDDAQSAQASGAPQDADTDAPQSDFQKLYGFAIERCRSIAPFLVQGMLYGWDFEYTPYDKARGVQEYWSFTSKSDFDGAAASGANRLEYQSPVVEDGKLMTWVYCARTPQQQLEFKRWSSINQPKVGATGEASVEDGFEGIQASCSAAAKQAVREYWRTKIKNKPKEISGSILLVGEPRIYIKNGKYVSDLDFLLETDRIVPYTYY